MRFKNSADVLSIIIFHERISIEWDCWSKPETERLSSFEIIPLSIRTSQTDSIDSSTSEVRNDLSSIKPKDKFGIYNSNLMNIFLGPLYLNIESLDKIFLNLEAESQELAVAILATFIDHRRWNKSFEA